MKKQIIKIGQLNIPRLEIGQGKPKILITAGIHGDEHSQQLVIKKLLKKLKDKLPITTVILPKLNPLGLKKNCEKNPIDNLNINRVFPGSPNSKYSSKRIASMILQEAKRSSIIIDLHNFSDPALPQTIFLNRGSQKLKQKNLKLCKLIDIPLVWKINPADKSILDVSKTQIFHTIKMGIPSVVIELPPINKLTQKQINQTVNGIINLINNLINKKINIKNKNLIFIRRDIKAMHEGIFKTKIKLGETIKKNSFLGEINNKKIVSPVAGYVIRLKENGRVNKKELLISIAKDKKAL